MGGVWRNGLGVRGFMASAVAQAYNGGLEMEPTARSRGRAPGEGSGCEAPLLKLKVFKYRMSRIRHEITSFQCFKR